MKAALYDAIEIGRIINLVKNEGEKTQYTKELIDYLDKVHNKIRTL